MEQWLKLSVWKLFYKYGGELMLDKRLLKQITVAIMSCTLAVGTAGINTVPATATESSTAENIETVPVESILHNGSPSAAIMSNGDLYCWGDNGFGDVGNGTTKEQLTPFRVLSNVKFAVCNESGNLYNTMMAITENGDLYCWGYNGDGQVGNGTTENQLTPFKVLDNVKSIDSYGERNSLVTAITENGDLYCWGENEYGKAGNGTTEYQYTPVKVLNNVKSVNEKSNTMTAITENGDLYCWGYNEYGQAGNGATEEQLTPVKVLDNVKSVNKYYETMAAITENGDLYCWGYNNYGKAGNGTTENQLTPVKVLDNVKSIDSYGKSDSLITAITENGSLYCWGYNEYGQVGNGKEGYNEEEDEPELQLTPFKVLDNVKSVKEQNGITTAITENGDLYCWGSNLNGRIGNGTTERQLTPVKVLDNVKFIDIYDSTMTVITENGDLYCWGSNGYGQVGNGTTEDQLTPVKVLDNVKSIESINIDNNTMKAITENGDLYFWGHHMGAAFGNETIEDQLTPVKVLDNVKSVKSIDIDNNAMTAITENGDLYCWGSNGDGQIGNGTTEYQYPPVKVLDNVKSVSSEEKDTMMAVKENGDLYCWGYNMGGAVGNGTTENQLTPVKVLPLEDAPGASAPTDTETPSTEIPMPTDTPATSDTSDIETGYKVTVANLKYTVTSVKGKQTVEFTGGKKTAKSIVIPSSIDIAGINYKVVSVANNACKNYKKLQKVTIGANINSIGNTAFSGCTKLKKIIFKTKKLTAGKTGFEAFKGVNKKVKVEGPKSKVKAYTRIVALKR